MSTQSSGIDTVGPAPVSPRTAILGPIAANIAFVMELTLVPLLLPAIQSQFDLTISQLAWVFNSYGIAVAIGVLLGGWFGDAFNTRTVFGFGVAFFAAGSLIVAAAESYEMIIMGRALQGLGGGIFSPLVPLLLTQASPQRPGRALIVWGSIAGYVAAFAPLFYGSLLGELIWNIAFVVTAVLALIALVILNRTQVTGVVAPKARMVMDYAALFHARNVWLTFIYVFCTYGSITYFLFRLPVWLSGNEVSATHVGLLLSVIWLSFSGLSTLLRNLVDRPFIRLIMLAAPILIAAGFALSFFDGSLALLILASVCVGSGLACSNAPSTQMILKFAPKGMSAVSTSLDITFARLGGIATVAILAETDVAHALPAICLLSLVAAYCALSVSRGLAGAN